MDQDEIIKWRIQISRAFNRSSKNIPCLLYLRLPYKTNPGERNLPKLIKEQKIFREFNTRVIYRHVKKLADAMIIKTWGNTRNKKAVRVELPPEIQDFVNDTIKTKMKWM